jgi:hypothetical protein
MMTLEMLQTMFAGEMRANQKKLELILETILQTENKEYGSLSCFVMHSLVISSPWRDSHCFGYIRYLL